MNGQKMSSAQIVDYLLRRGRESLGPADLWIGQMSKAGLDRNDIEEAVRIAACVIGLHRAVFNDHIRDDAPPAVYFLTKAESKMNFVDLLVIGDNIAYALQAVGAAKSFGEYVSLVKESIPEADDDIALLSLAARAVRYRLNYCKQISPILPGDPLPAADTKMAKIIAPIRDQYCRIGVKGGRAADNLQSRTQYDGMVVEVAVALRCVQPLSLAELASTVAMRRSYRNSIVNGDMGYAS